MITRWKLVPVDPAAAMIKAGSDAYGLSLDDNQEWLDGKFEPIAEKIYCDMLYQSPLPPSSLENEIARIVCCSCSVEYGRCISSDQNNCGANLAHNIKTARAILRKLSGES